MDFALSSRLHLHRAYVVTVCNQIWIAVGIIVAKGTKKLPEVKFEGLKELLLSPLFLRISYANP